VHAEAVDFEILGHIRRIVTFTEIVDDARAITPGLEHINRTGGVVAHALPYLYGFAEEIVAKVTPRPAREGAVGRRRSRIHETVGYRP